MLTYTYDTAREEAARCLMCDDAPCFKGCPASVNPRKFIRKIRFDDLAGAARLLREANILAASCSYICPCNLTCCSECTHEKLTRPIDIRGLQRYVMDWEREHPLSLTLSHKGRGNVSAKVAVIGSGPAGLSCAAALAKTGCSVEVFERENSIGGQLRLSIPEFRLPSKVLDSDVEFIKKLGVRFNIKIPALTTEELKEKGFDSIFVATGLMKSKKMGIEGEDKEGVFDALNFLIRSKRGEKIKLGKRVLVIGGGDTALDAARVAAKSGAQVIVLYRRTQKELPAYRPDINEAFEEGIEFYFRVKPIAVLGQKKVTGLKVNRINWKGSGRQATEYTVEDEFEIKADTIINAVGQEAEVNMDSGFRDCVTIPSPPVGEGQGEGEVVDFTHPPLHPLPSREGRNLIMTQSLRRNDKFGVFVGGDLANGASTAVAAIGDGIKAAEKIAKSLNLCTPKNDRRPTTDGRHLFITFCGVKFENPFVLAAAPPTDDLEMLRSGLKAGWAGAILKTTSVKETPVELKYPMMSGIDLESSKLASMGNIDLISEHHIDVVEDRVKKLKEEFPNKVIIASIMGSKKEEWQSLVKRLSDAGVDMIECSFSCPQGSLGAKPGQMLAQDAKLTKTVASWVKEAARAHKRNVPVVIKITPHVTDVTEVAAAVKEAGCDAVCASNTIQSLMGVDLQTWVPNPNVEGKSTYSGMSGPAIKPITLKVISEIARKVGIPIAGTGGPVTWKDAAEFMLCGASIVEFCTAVMHYGFDIIDDLKDGLSQYLAEKKLKNVSDLIGRALPNIVTHENLSYSKKVVSTIDYDKCICDGLCYIACRDGGHMAISVDKERKPTVDEEKCVGCGLCKLICPVSECIKLKNI